MKGSRFSFHGSYWLILILILLLTLAIGVSAQTGDGYDLTWNTVDGGGYTWSEGEGYSLGGTMGQPDAGVISGAGYTLIGGFWSGGVTGLRLYLPLVLRN